MITNPKYLPALKAEKVQLGGESVLFDADKHGVDKSVIDKFIADKIGLDKVVVNRVGADEISASEKKDASLQVTEDKYDKNNKDSKTDTFDIVKKIKQELSQENEELYKTVTQTREEVAKLQLEQTKTQQEQMVSQTQQQIQKTRYEMWLSAIEHAKTIENMIRATLKKLYEMETQMQMMEHQTLMAVGEGWWKVLGKWKD